MIVEYLGLSASIKRPPLAVRKFFSSNFLLIASVIILAGAGFGYLAGHYSGYKTAQDRTRRLATGSINCNPGPWGDLSYVPFTIAAPDEMLPVRGIEAAGMHWVLPGYTTDSFVSLLQSTDLRPEVQQQWLADDVFHPTADGVQLTPTPDLALSLTPAAREKIYRVLSQSPANDGELNYISTDFMAEQFAGISPATMAVFKQMCVVRGDYQMFAGVSAILSKIPSYEEKTLFAKALTRQRTMLLNLRITQQSDIDALEKYWDRGCWGTDLRTTLESFSKIPNGTLMNILMILPTLPSSEIYLYPNVVDNPLDGPPVNRDCAWTSFNFFRDTPNPDFGKLPYVMKELNANYYALNEAPHYGDLVVIARPDGFLVHVAIYIADDIWFTKNGSNMAHPWMLSSEDDVLKQFEFQIDPGQHLIVKYFRNKRI
jgi:hypothetical protein